MDEKDSEVEDAVQLGSQLIESILSFSPPDLPHVQSLIKAGAPLWYQQEKDGLSALHAACFVEYPDLVRILIENGAVWNSGAYLSLARWQKECKNAHGQSMTWATLRVILPSRSTMKSHTGSYATQDFVLVNIFLSDLSLGVLTSPSQNTSYTSCRRHHLEPHPQFCGAQMMGHSVLQTPSWMLNSSFILTTTGKRSAV